MHLWFWAQVQSVLRAVFPLMCAGKSSLHIEGCGILCRLLSYLLNPLAVRWKASRALGLARF